MPFYYWPGAVMCYVGFGLLLLDLYFEPKLTQAGRLVLFAALGGLVITFTFGFVFVSAPLQFAAISYGSNYPPGTQIAGIKWSNKYSELHIDIENPTNYDYDDVKVVVRPDQPVVAIGQLEGTPELSFEDASRSEIHTNLAMDYSRVLIASTEGYRLSCDKLEAGSLVKVVMAIATVTKDAEGGFDENGKPRPDALIQIAFQDGGTVWFRDAIKDEDYGEKPTARSVDIKGTYRALLKNRTISEDISVSAF